MQKSFTGFSKQTLNFLQNLKENNNKIWFEQNKHVYNEHLLQPFRNLVSDLTGEMLVIDSSFEILPSVNKTISRIYRDTRFSKDKSLFRSNMWLTFKRRNKDWKNAPAYFFEIFPDYYRYGMGYFQASRDTIDLLKKSIDNNLALFLEAIKFHKSQTMFILKNEKYKL